MKCIIPCAGESSRMSFVPKHLVQIGGKPLIYHVIDTWKGSVDGFIFVLKRAQTYMWEYLPEDSAVVFQDESKGLADAILRAEPYVNGRFIIALGDCLHRGTFEEKEFDLGIGVWSTDNLVELNKSYLVAVRNGKVGLLAEKPDIKKLSGPLHCGMGTYFMDKRVFSYIRSTAVTPGGKDFTEVLQSMVNHGETITPVMFTGKYINVGSPEDLKVAEEMLK